ncbi:exodeoxyribonuclease III [Faecalicoccus acidiformans]|uniref:exodeoxyribonuclease III n=1 Tax=Faecalicoccus acidiformans TaxID=915173 RepID=UPI0025A41AAF|nr:exodeoxyribonuclease III [Faecalicoccus acidiformans]MDM8204012.1 exodeoxyribonuclease III [Faecalicoccus acidiformans]
MKFISWNVNGIRACINKGFLDIVDTLDADVVCLQETKAQPEQIDIPEDLYPYQYAYSAIRKGYSGTMILSRIKPLNVIYGLGIDQHDTEGRVITAEFDDYYLVTVYTPNSGDGLKRLSYRMEWDQVFSRYIQSLNKPVFICGDLNVANEEIDIKNPKTNRRNAGFTDEERDSFKSNLLTCVKDTFRTLYPDKIQYSWWSYRFNARKNNAGWRIDYWLASEELMPRVKDSLILTDIYGSDHCPVELDIMD